MGAVRFPTRLIARLVDRGAAEVNHHAMDLDDILPKAPGDPLAALVRQDLDPLSVAELETRIAALEGEIDRSRKKIERAVNHRAKADGLFRR
ncbi:DUF1192 domain-containing protein [Sphingomonas nostoxanthinifaciens]